MTKIYEEIKQVKPFRIHGQEAHVSIIRTADVLGHAVGQVIARFGISLEQYNALRILRGAGDGGLPTLEIASRMISRSPNITRLLDKLIDKRLASRLRSEQDRRVVYISITSKGAELLGQLNPLVDEAFARFPAMTKDEMRTLLDLLDRIREGMASTRSSKRRFDNAGT
jgi:DNA-binding MarR family transcriptional regulator